MFTVLFSAISAYALFIFGQPILRYLWDAKGLRKYPAQNFFSGLTGLAYGWEVGRSHKQFHTRRLHDKLTNNPVVRIGPNWLSFGRARAARDIYGYASPCNKTGVYDSLNEVGEDNLITITSRVAHTDRRKMVATAYAPRNIEMWEPHVAESARVLLSKLDPQCTLPLSSSLGTISKDQLTCDGNLWGMLFAFECTIKIGLSKDVGFIAQGSDLVVSKRADGTSKEVNAIECLRSGSRVAATLIWDVENFSMWKWIVPKVSSWYATQFENASYWRPWVHQLAVERLERSDMGEELDDLCQPMIMDRNGIAADIGAPSRESEIHQIINGGGDGPGISLVNALYFLVKNRNVMERLRAELDEALAPEDDVAPWSKIKNLPYIRACVDESMRISPPVATDLIRTVPSDRSYEVDGHVVPPGTHVSISAYTAQRDPEVFPDPEAFMPERWLTKGDGNRDDMLAAYIPFSAGSRGCIGRNVTILVQLVYIATLVHRYEFALPSSEWEMEWDDYFNLSPKELPLKIWRRQLSAMH